MGLDAATSRLLIASGVVLAALAAGHQVPAVKPVAAAITVDYPVEGSIFPPEITAPTFLWHDAENSAAMWQIEVAFADGSPGIRATSYGERLRIGEIDPRCVSDTNKPPALTPQLAAAHSWAPDAGSWEAIKKRSVAGAATVTISGFRKEEPGRAVSRGRVTIRTSRDPVGAPIFYRDVPLMPAETERGVIKPLAPQAVRLINWRLRHVGETRSRLLLENLPTCANCHSFSSDGRTLGMDLDGPQNNKGMYTLAPIAPEMSIRSGDVIEWSSVKGKLEGKIRVGFMSQVSPDGQYVVTRIDPSGNDPARNYYVANFTDYRFLQVFYPTRGVLAWYSRATGVLQPLPGADDPRYVQTSAFWSPDGKYLVFARAEAKDANPVGALLAKFSNDPNERQIQYDLYRVPFNQGQGGRAEPVAGASRNGMSNTFPKVSPDGRWIVFVECRNGQLMRPDSQLFIVPAAGGQARRMRCNTPLMNSWHSFSPNGRWLVFSSKSRSPYTQMFLTHLDEDGNDSPAILIDNATAANRAVNIPEFLNIPPDGLRKIDIQAVESYRLVDSALELQGKGEYAAAIEAWTKFLETSQEDANAHNNLGTVLSQTGRFYEAITHLQKAIELQPGSAQAHSNLGSVLGMQGRLPEAIVHLERAVEMNPDSAPFENNLGMALLQADRPEEAIAHFRKATVLNPGFVQAYSNLGGALATRGRMAEAIVHFQKAVDLDPKHAQSRFNLGLAFSAGGETGKAMEQWREVLRLQPNSVPALSQTAWVLATSPQASMRNGGEAVRLADRAMQTSGGGDPAVLDTLAAAYAEAGRYPEAAQTARKALAAVMRQNRPALVEALQARIALYEAKTPFRETRPPTARP